MTIVSNSTDALCKGVSATRAAVGAYATVFEKDPLGVALGKIYRDKNPLVGGSRQDTTTRGAPHFRNPI
jgi:hypothetical protein